MSHRYVPDSLPLDERIIALLATLLILIQLTHTELEEGFGELVLGVLLPLGLAVLLGYVAIVLGNSDLSISEKAIVGGYTLLGSGFATSVEAVAVVYRHMEMGDLQLLANLGHELYVLVTFATIGGLAGWLVGWNNAHRRHEHRKLERANRQLRARQEQLSEVTSVLAHDLRNPMNVAMGRVDLLRETGEDKHLDAIDRALERMETIISETLMLASQDRVIGERTDVPLERVAREAWEMVETGQTELAVDSAATIQADEGKLQQAFENLFRNAVDHGGAELQTVRVGMDDHVLYVEDDGVGIPPDQQDRVFNTGMTTESDGTGLGLAIVKKVVEAHDWSISTAENEWDGARIEIEICDPLGMSS